MKEFKKEKQMTIKKLSDCKYQNKIAFCPRCDEFFINDLPVFGNLRCPNEDCGRSLTTTLTLKGGVVYDDRGRIFRKLL